MDSNPLLKMVVIFNPRCTPFEIRVLFSHLESLGRTDHNKEIAGLFVRIVVK